MFTESIAFQMSLLLCVALAGYLIAMRIHQSAVVGVILVGMLVGPGVLGIITYTDFVASLAQLGAVFLLFVIGLEFKLKDILQPKYLWIALLGVILPWGGGYLVAKLFGFNFGSALLIGAALTATSIAITANVLKEMGKLQTPVAKAIIGAAVIDDILALLVLSVSLKLVEGTFSWGVLLLILGKAILFLVLGIIVGFLFFTKLVVRIDRTTIAKKYPEFVFIFALLIAFVYALSAELIGLSAIVGSFIAGVSLEGVALRQSKSYKEGAEYLYIIFASIFFVSLGVLADFKALSLVLVIFLVVLTLLAILTKVIGCGLPAWIQGMSFKDSMIVGFGMAPRGEVAMVVGLLALNQNLIQQNVYVVIVLMSLLTTMITPLVFQNWLFSSEKKKIDIPLRRKG